MAVSYPISLTRTVGQPIQLTIVAPKARTLEFADEIGRAVESTVQQVSGDGQRTPAWIEFDTWLPARGSPSAKAAVLAAFEDGLRYVTQAGIDTLVYPIIRIRVVSRSPTAAGYRLGIKMIGPKFDFQTSTGTPAPLW
ncbi:hypothetical protein [Deinococcus sp. UYEF24]